jgi:hypothetical protein
MPQFTALPASSVASGASKTVDVDCRRVRTLTVIWRLLGTTTVGDLTLNDALPMLQDGTVIPVGLAAVTSVAPVSDGANVVAMKQYNVSGLERLRLTAKNNNVGALNLTVDVGQEITL